MTPVPPYEFVVLLCIDGQLPTFEVDNWVEVNKPYRLLSYANAINHSDSMSYVVADLKTGKVVRPNIDYPGFRSDRFQLMFALNLN